MPIVLLLAGLGVAILAFSVNPITEDEFVSTSGVRGIRNNNPGNIRKGENWQGMAQTQSDPAFIQFKSPEYGIRAMVKLLRNYEKLYNLNTIKGIIFRWAPPNENNTEAYVKSVEQKTGLKQNEALDLADQNVMRKLVKAIIFHENGQQPYTDKQINDGINLAGQ